MTQLYNLTGLHIQKNSGALFDGAFDLLLQKDEKGKLIVPLATLTFAGSPSEFGWLDAFHIAQPNCKITGRLTILESLVSGLFESNKSAAQMAVEYVTAFVAQNPRKYVYWVVVDGQGEWGGGEGNDWVRHAAFDYEVAIRLHALGYKVGLGNWSEGNPPEPPYNPNFAHIWTVIYDKVLRWIDSVGSDWAVIQRHAYWVHCLDPKERDAHLMRPVLLQEYCADAGLDNVTTILGEVGGDVPGLYDCTPPEGENGHPIDKDLWIANVMAAINALLNLIPKLWGGSWYTYDKSFDGRGPYRITRDTIIAWAEQARKLALRTNINAPGSGTTNPPPTQPPVDPPAPQPSEITVFDMHLAYTKPPRTGFLPGDNNGDRWMPADENGQDLFFYGWDEPGDKVSHVEPYPPVGTGYPAPSALRIQNQAPKINFWFGRVIETKPGDVITVTVESESEIKDVEGGSVVRRILIDPAGLRYEGNFAGQNAGLGGLPSAEVKGLGIAEGTIPFTATGPRTTVILQTRCGVPARVNTDYTCFTVKIRKAVGTPPIDTGIGPAITREDTGILYNLRLTAAALGDSNLLKGELPARTKVHRTGKRQNGYSQVVVRLSLDDAGPAINIVGWLLTVGLQPVQS